MQRGIGRWQSPSAQISCRYPARVIAAIAGPALPSARSAISLSKKFLPDNNRDGESEAGLFKRLGAQTVVAATVRAIALRASGVHFRPTLPWKCLCCPRLSGTS